MANNQKSNFRAKIPRRNDQEYKIYLAYCDDGSGGDLTRGGAPLKTIEEWLEN